MQTKFKVDWSLVLIVLVVAAAVIVAIAILTWTQAWTPGPTQPGQTHGDYQLLQGGVEAGIITIDGVRCAVLLTHPGGSIDCDWRD